MVSPVDNRDGKRATQGCPCGYWNSVVKDCLCTPLQIQRYISKISRPLLDRIDLHIDVPEVNYKDLTGKSDGEPSAPIAARVQQARQAQVERFGGNSEPLTPKSEGANTGKGETSKKGVATGAGGDNGTSKNSSSEAKSPRPIFCNAQMSARQIEKHCRLDSRSKGILERAIEELGFSARAYNRILKVSRTIADLEGSTKIRPAHVSEAIQYRSLDRSCWGP